MMRGVRMERSAVTGTANPIRIHLRPVCSMPNAHLAKSAWMASASLTPTHWGSASTTRIVTGEKYASTSLVSLLQFKSACKTRSVVPMRSVEMVNVFSMDRDCAKRPVCSPQTENVTMAVRARSRAYVS